MLLELLGGELPACGCCAERGKLDARCSFFLSRCSWASGNAIKSCFHGAFFLYLRRKAYPKGCVSPVFCEGRHILQGVYHRCLLRCACVCVATG